MNDDKFDNISDFFKKKEFIYLLTFLLVLFFIFFLIRSYTTYVILAIFSLVGLLIYIEYDHLDVRNRMETDGFLPPFKVILIIYFITLILCLFYLQFYSGYYCKSLIYYLFIGICSASIFLQSQYNKKNWLKCILPYMISLIGIITYLGNFIVFPYGVYASGDTHYIIYNLLLPLLNNGRIPSGHISSYFPLHYTYVAMSTQITGLNPIILYKGLIGLIYALLVLPIYCFCTRLIDAKYGVVCSLIYISTPEIAYHALHAYQFSYATAIGLLLLIFTFFLIIKEDKKDSDYQLKDKMTYFIILYMLLIISLVWTHHYTTLIIFIDIVIAFIIAIYFENRIKNLNTIYFYSFLFFITIFLAHWSYVSSTIAQATYAIQIYYLSFSNLENYQEALSVARSIQYAQPMCITLLNTSSKGFLFLFGIIGIIWGIRNKNIVFLIMTIYAIIDWTLISIGTFIKVPLLMDIRLSTIFVITSMIYLAAYGCLTLTERLGTKKKTIIFSAAFIILPILGLGSMYAGQETSIFKGDVPTLKLYDTNSDIQNLLWVQRDLPKNSTIYKSEPWTYSSIDKYRKYFRIPINTENKIYLNKSIFEEYIILSEYDISGEIRAPAISEPEQLYKIRTSEITTIEADTMHIRNIKLSKFDVANLTNDLLYIYSNGEVNLYYLR